MLLKAGYAMMALAMALAGVVIAIVWMDEPARSAAVRSATQDPSEPLKRTDPGVEPWREATVGPSTSGEDEPSEPKPEPASEPERSPEVAKNPGPEPVAEDAPEPQPDPQPDPEPVIEGDPPEPTPDQVASAHEPRHYDLPDGAVMGLTIEAMGIHNVPVFDSVGEWALGHGVGHHPRTSMPWSGSSQRNVYLAGHKLGYPGTASHLVFYRLGELGRGDEILLKDRDGTRYLYRVSEAFKTEPNDSWVTAQVPGRDMVTLQTCTGENWSRRLIVRADRA